MRSCNARGNDQSDRGERNAGCCARDGQGAGVPQGVDLAVHRLELRPAGDVDLHEIESVRLPLLLEQGLCDLAGVGALRAVGGDVVHQQEAALLILDRHACGEHFENTPQDTQFGILCERAVGLGRGGLQVVFSGALHNCGA